MKPGRRVKITNKVLLVILLISLTLSLAGSWFGLPYLYHPDEHFIIDSALGFFRGDLNPHMFYYPGFYLYLTALIFLIVFPVIFLGGYFSGSFINFSQYKTYIINNMWIPHFIGRLITVVMAVGAVYVTYLIGKKISNRKTGLISAFLLAISPLFVRNSRYATVDIPFTFWTLLAIYFCIEIYKRKDTKSYLLAGFFTGLAISTKYFAIFLVIPITLAHFLSSKSFKPLNLIKRVFSKKIILCLLLFFFTFFITSPFIFLDYKTTYNQLSYLKGRQVDTPHLGFENMKSGHWHIIKEYLTADLGIAFLFCFILGMIVMSLTKSRTFLVFLSYPILFFLYSGTWKTIFSRSILVLMPFFAICTGYFIYEISNCIKNRKLKTLTLTTLIILILITPLTNTITGTRDLFKLDTRTFAKEWIEKTIPENSVIAYEFYCPQLDQQPKKDFKLIESKWGIVLKPLSYYKERGVDYIILSSEFKERYIEASNYRRMEIERYKQIEEETTLIKTFYPGEMTGPMIWIYKLN